MPRNIASSVIRRFLPGTFLLCCSCSNTIYFYETEKISLTVEGRPDSTQPVQGNLGIKQRAVLIVPPKDGGEALSAISSFQFTKLPGGFFNLGTVAIRSALVTGEAATSPSTPQQAVARAVTEGVALQSTEALAEKGIKLAGKANQQDRLRDLVKSKPEWKDLSPAEKDELAEITLGVKLGELYTEEYHNTIVKKLGGDL